MPTYETSRDSQQAGVISLIKWGVLAIVLVFLLLLGSCGMNRVSPDAGYEAVLVQKPMFFGHGGVAEQPVSTGSEWVVWTTTPIMVNMQPQLFTFSTSDMMSSNGIPLHFDAALRLQVTDSVMMVKKFGPRWYENNLSSEFANRVRQAVRKHSMNSLAIETNGVDEVDAEVTTGLTNFIKSSGLPVRLIKVTVGKATPPEEIKQQRIATAAQQQRQQTEMETKLAEDKREAAERSRATADNAYRQTLNLSPAEFVRLQEIDMQMKVCAQKDAHCAFFIGGEVKPVVNAGR